MHLHASGRCLHILEGVVVSEQYVPFHDESGTHLTVKVPIKDSSCNLLTIKEPKRKFNKQFPVDYKPKPSDDSLRASARMLRATVGSSYEESDGSVRLSATLSSDAIAAFLKGMRVTCPAKLFGQNVLDMEWIADTGSAKDFIARRELGHLKEHPSERPIATGPSSAEDQCTIDVPSMSSKAEPYVIPETPSVLPVVQRCMDEGFDFVWRAFKRPNFQKQPGGKNVYMDARDCVPYLKAWHENLAPPARVRAEALPTKESPTERSGHQKQELKPSRCARSMLNNKDFERDSCLELLKSIVFAANRKNQSGLSTEGGVPNVLERNATLGAVVHGGMKGVTKRILQHLDLAKCLVAFMKYHGSQDESTSISIVQESARPTEVLGNCTPQVMLAANDGEIIVTSSPAI